jgi:hypothetical protein
MDIMTIADVESYMNEIVDPTITDFEREPTSRRRAFLACVAVFHTVDYLAKRPGSPNRQNLRNQFRKNTNFAAVDRVAHAFKHVQAEGNNPLHFMAVFERPPGTLPMLQAGLSRIGDTVGGVDIWNEDTDGLLLIAKRAAAFLRTKMPSGTGR